MNSDRPKACRYFYLRIAMGLKPIAMLGWALRRYWRYGKMIAIVSDITYRR